MRLAINRHSPSGDSAIETNKGAVGHELLLGRTRRNPVARAFHSSQTEAQSRVERTRQVSSHRVQTIDVLRSQHLRFTFSKADIEAFELSNVEILTPGRSTFPGAVAFTWRNSTQPPTLGLSR